MSSFHPLGKSGKNKQELAEHSMTLNVISVGGLW